MSKISISLLFFICFSASATDWDQKFQEVCSIDRLCVRLKTSDGAWFRPKGEVIALLKDPEVQKQIKTVSKEYGVDPIAVAGAIAAENSLNVGVKDTAQTWLAAKMGITSIAGKNFSFGLGQITLPAAREAENYLAKLENRTPKSDSELTQEIADPMGSLRIAATIIRKVQDDYAAQGFTIADKPEILTSLYNLGKSEERAKKAKESGTLPRENYFGLFVEKYSSDIKTATGLDKPVAKAASGPTSSQTSTATTAKLDTSIKKSRKARSLQTDVTSSVPLVSFPLFCKSSTYGQDMQSIVDSTSNGTPTGVLEKGATYTVESRSLDCNSEKWSLVNSRDGKLGWIKEEELAKVTESKLADIPTCQNDAEKSCSASAKTDTEKYELKESDGSLTYMKPVGPSADSKDLTFDKASYACGGGIGNQGGAYQPFSSFGSSSGGGQSACPGCMYSGTQPAQANPKSLEELRKTNEDFIKIVDAELNKMSLEVGVRTDKLEEAENPYSSVATQLIGAKATANRCLKTYESETPDCSDREASNLALKVAAKQTEYKKEPLVSDIQTVHQSLTFGLYFSFYNAKSYYSQYFPTTAELAKITDKDVRDSIELCKSEFHKITPGNLIPFDDIPSNIAALSDTEFASVKGVTIEYARACHARLNLMRPSPGGNSIVCTTAPKVMNLSMSNFTKEFVAKAYQSNPQILLQDLGARAAEFSIKLPKKGVPIGTTAYGGSGYCPNKTAEYIEELLKKNPCISKVYVPTEYLARKLTTLGSKVVYRKFDKNDRYAIELGEVKCK